jgi:integrase
VRAPGTGTVETLPSGRFRPVLPGRRGKKLPTRDSYEDAARDLDLALALIQQEALRPLPQGHELGPYGRAVLRRRQGQGYTNARRELSRWTTHVERGELARETVESLTRPRVVEWVRRLATTTTRPGNGHQEHAPRPLSRSVVLDALRILRAVVKEALLEGLRVDDPTLHVEVPRARGVTHDPWTYLRPAEVVRLLEAGRTAMVERDPGGRRAEGTTPAPVKVRLVHPEDLDLAIVAIYTGLREGELYTLHGRDVDLERGRIVVRYGGREGATLRPTKGRRPRVLVLLPPALEALRRQVDRRGAEGLVFPSLTSKGTGRYRAPCRPPRCWDAWVRAAGLGAGRADPAPVTWHTLRHTFATLALAGRLPGVEGEGWRLERVSAYLGHRSIAITQRYADVAELL